MQISSKVHVADYEYIRTEKQSVVVLTASWLLQCLQQTVMLYAEHNTAASLNITEALNCRFSKVFDYSGCLTIYPFMYKNALALGIPDVRRRISTTSPPKKGRKGAV